MWCFLICCIKWFFKTYSVFLFNFFSRWFIYLPSSSFKLVLTIFHSKLLKEKLWSRMEWNRKAKNPWNKTQSLLLLKSQHFTNYTQTKHRTGEGNGTPLQYSCLENPMDGGAWWAAVHGVAKTQTWLSDFTFTFHFHALEKEMATHSSVLAWRIPGMGGSHRQWLPSVGLHRVGHDWSGLAAKHRTRFALRVSAALPGSGSPPMPVMELPHACCLSSCWVWRSAHLHIIRRPRLEDSKVLKSQMVMALSMPLVQNLQQSWLSTS